MEEKKLCGLYMRVSTEDQAREDDYIWNKENDKNKDKEKDDYEIEM